MISLFYHYLYKWRLFLVPLFFISLLWLTVHAANKIYSSNSLFFQITGLYPVACKVVYLQKAIYWGFRAYKHPQNASDENIKKHYGSVISLNRDGSINFEIYKNKKEHPVTGKIANVQIINIAGLAKNLLETKLKKITFGIFKNGSVIVWVDDQIWNLELVCSGVAVPEKQPPTNLADILFARFYMNKFFE